MNDQNTVMFKFVSNLTYSVTNGYFRSHNNKFIIREFLSLKASRFRERQTACSNILGNIFVERFRFTIFFFASKE